jgi:hypothetical protein
MLMVLMALVELGRTRVSKATRWLWLVLSGGVASAQVACDLNQGGPVYGPPLDADAQGPAPDAADVFEGVDAPVYGPPPDVVEATDADIPQVLYGPVMDVTPDEATDVPPVDVAEVVPDVPKDCEPMVAYGPPPCDSDADCEQWFGAGWTCDKSAVISDGCQSYPYPSCVPGSLDVIEVVDVNPDCGPAGWYGPPPCQSDEECRKDYGDGWYCDKEYKVDSPCGAITYPMCMPPSVDAITPDTPVDVGPDCPNVVYYGPPPPYGVGICMTDQDCVNQGYPAGTKCVQDPCNPYTTECVPPG